MDAALAAVALVPGLALGSFLNVIAARLPERRSIVHPGSACMSCGEPIRWFDNIPLVSYLVLRGRCRGCGARYGLLYPAVELASGLLVAACVWRFGLSGKAAVAALFCLALVAVSATDIRKRIIPNRIVLPAAALVLVGMTAVEPSPQWAIGAVGASLFLFIALLAYPAGMGMGDVKLALLLGAATGYYVPVAMMVGMLTALVPSAVLLAKYGPAARKMKIPFGPFLALGGIVALFAGKPLADAYLTLF
jgi:leader peptidase (prepilin peptidase) / N-methyltransferase